MGVLVTTTTNAPIFIFMNKICTKCKNDLPANCFDKTKLTSDGLQCWCKACRKANYAIKNNRPINEIVTSLPDGIWSDLSYIAEGYQISNMGRVKSMQRKGKIGDKILKPYDNTFGYLHIDIGNCTKKVHRLVATAFIPNPENKKYVNHKKGIKYDNRATELEWSTFPENMQHAFRTGLMNNRQGENNNFSKLTDIEVLDIFSSTETQSNLSKKYKVSIATISDIKNMKIWEHITMPVLKPKKEHE